MKNRNGFTLIELMVTMAIAALALSIAVPSYQASVQNNRRITSVNALATALQVARNTAITRRVTVTVCRSNDGANCLNGGGSGDWTQGWMIFTDPNNSATLEANETLLRVQNTLAASTSFVGNNNVVNSVSFSAQGLARGSNGTITHCDARGNTDASALIISIGGQVRHAVDTDADSIVDTGTAGTVGVNVVCPP